MNRFGYFFALLCLTLASLCSTAHAQFGKHATVEIYAQQSPLVAGSETRLAVTLDVEQGWHAQSAVPYEENLEATVLTLDPAAGIELSTILYPRGIDEKKVNPLPGTPDKASVYRKFNVILIPIKIAANAAPGKITITGSIKVQYCDDRTGSCAQPVDLKFSLPVTIAAAGTASTPADQDVFVDADKQSFYNPIVISPPATQSATKPADTRSTSSAAGVDVDLMSDADQIAYIESHAFAPANDEHYPFWLLACFALLGGVILNVMPCVLPVIPLKVLGLVQQAHGDRRRSLFHALAFSSGIITLFIILAIALKSLGLFYGQQFQSTPFLLAMAYLVLALALSMIGVWTLNPPTAVYSIDKPRSGYHGSFMNGLLATLLATPCSGPYLGPVFAWALVQPVWVTMFGLALVGVGMSLPYILLAAFPGALKKIPSGGRWAELLKQGLGIVMVGVAVYLLTRISNVNYWSAAFFGAVIVGLVCWAWGQIPSPTADPSRVWITRITAVVLGAALAYGIGMITIPEPPPPKTGPSVERIADKSDGRTWLPFNIELLNKGLQQGRPVIVDWTASWCPQCQTLEATVLSSDTIRKEFTNRNALLLKADLSARNKPREDLNAKLGGQSIPVLAIFTPGKPLHPQVLRDGYTTSTLLDRLNR